MEHGRDCLYVVVGNTAFLCAIRQWNFAKGAFSVVVSSPPPFRRRARDSCSILDLCAFSQVKKGKYVIGGSRWAHISDEAKDFIKLLLEPKASKRYVSRVPGPPAGTQNGTRFSIGIQIQSICRF